MNIGLWNIPLLDLYVACGMPVVLLFQLYFYLRYIRLPRIRKDASTPRLQPKHAGDQLDLFDEDVRGVSVIIAARNEARNLQDYLPSILEQDYPMFEVIVVDDGSEDNTRAILDDMAFHYPRLRRSFVPNQARIISSKKLALNLGIKAARFDYLLFTDADCRPASKYWIWEMMQGFDRNRPTDVVLGMGAYFTRKGWLNRLICYDTLFLSLQYLGAARAQHPYMGVGRNMAYRKDWFNRHKGFSPYLGERAGDDDLLINRNAEGSSTTTITSPDSLTFSPAKRTWKEWWHQKQRHLGVSHHYTLMSRLRLGFEPVTRAIWYSLAILLTWDGCNLLFNGDQAGWLIIGFVGAMLLIRFLTRLITLTVSAKRLGVERPKADILVWDILLPLFSLWILLFSPRKQARW
ncbi:MAG: glycosyltransferase [Paludibacteraceae bacterium]|nr:glycosyltransferase [Paludibacteraceae bacterium]